MLPPMAVPLESTGETCCALKLLIEFGPPRKKRSNSGTELVDQPSE